MDILINNIRKVMGEITIPGDKSISHRALMIGAIANGKTIIDYLLPSKDVFSTMNCLKVMGVSIEMQGSKIIVDGRGIEGLKVHDKLMDAGNSGTTIRLLLGLIAGSKNRYYFIGDDSLSKRPMARITEPLIKMGVEVKFTDKYGYLPLEIQGSRLKPIDYILKIPSAQVKSAIILASINAEGISTIEEPVPSRNHTEIMINYFEGNIQKQNNKLIIQGKQYLKGKRVEVPGDISSAAFFMVLSCIIPNSEIIIRNVGLNPTRSGIIDVLNKMNANIEILNHKIISGEIKGDLLIKSSYLTATTISDEIIPKLIDEIPIIAVAACFANGRTIIKDARELRVKESDRIEMMVNQLKKMGADIEATEDGMIIDGVQALKGAVVDSGNDHRIAMSLAIAGLRAEGNTKILNGDCVDISFPDFYNKLKQICI